MTPPMGWNSYNKFGGNVTEAQVKAIADAFVSQGLQAVGYEYIVVDYCWSQSSRDASGQMVPVASKFPSGMKALGDYIHGKGLKFGMYQSPTKVTCCSEPGSYQHEASDALQFASWGVDYLKYDWCGVQSHENGTVTSADVIARYTTMRDAIKAAARPMVYAMCEKGQGAKGVQPATWSAPVGNMWRIGNDIGASWARVLTSFDSDLSLAQYAGPGGWNDPDMLEVGNGGMTDGQNRAHFSLWSIVAAPLMLGNDPSTMPAAVKTILTNTEVIAVDQDALGKQGQRVAMSGQTEVWSKPMQDGSVAVVLFNRGGASATVFVSWSAIGVAGSSRVRDLWTHTDQGAFATSYSATVPGQDVVMIRVFPPGVVEDGGAAPHDSGGAMTGGGSGAADAASSGSSSGAYVVNQNTDAAYGGDATTTGGSNLGSGSPPGGGGSSGGAGSGGDANAGGGASSGAEPGGAGTSGSATTGSRGVEGPSGAPRGGCAVARDERRGSWPVELMLLGAALPLGAWRRRTTPSRRRH